MNFALAANGSVATASSTYNQCCGFTPAAAIDGEHKGLNWLNGGGWHGGTNSFSQWLQVDLNASRTIDEVDVYTGQDDYANPIEPTETTTFSLYGLTAFDVKYWDGSAWLTVPGGSVSGNNKVWKKITFSAITTTKIQLVMNGSVDGWSRMPEIEVWGPTPPRTNVALAANGGLASASSNYSDGTYNFTAAGANNGVRSGAPWGAGEGWQSSTPSVPQWLQVDFNGNKTIDEIDVFSVQDNWQSPSEPTEAMTFSLYGLTTFQAQYWNGSDWATVPGGNVSGNNKIWKQIAFPSITTQRIRVFINGSSGWSHLTEVEAWEAPAGDIGGTASDFAMTRLDPHNRTGTGGVDLLSNDFNWNLPLVGLPGRGLDLGLTLSYNSLVWTKSGNNIAFDLDEGSIAPGFRLGFPTIEGPYWNNQANANFYLLVTPSGGRVELRQSASGSTVYESKESSYLRLTDNLNETMTLRPTDGSQLLYNATGNGWRCTKVTDRNGNYLTIAYKSWGEIDTVTDTLNRTLTFNYDSNWNIQSITQSWAGQPQHEWATFGWGTASIGNNFAGLNNLGPNNTSIPVLTQVGLPDGSHYSFGYNSTGQVDSISRAQSDNLNHTYTIYEYSSPGDDCPRLTQTRSWAANWSDQQGVPHEVTTSFGHDADGGCRMTMPDGTVYKEYYGSGYKAGLTTETRNYASIADANVDSNHSQICQTATWQKCTSVGWTQDATDVSYLTNPRVTETNIYDSSGNRRRTTIDYSNATYAQYGLPYFVTEYAANGSTELRRTYSDYNLSADYVNRRIIGLVDTVHVFDAVSGSHVSKVSFSYDWDNQSNTYLIDQGAATNHDNVNYGAAFRIGRGNLCAVRRWNVNAVNDWNQGQWTSFTGYNTNGSVIFTADALGHENRASYSDSFSLDGTSVNNPSVNTLAYPTTVTDADGFSSTVRYRYDFGAKTRVAGPPPAGQSQGAIQTTLYDDAGRISRITTHNNSAYTRYVYGPDYLETYSTVNNVADEAFTFQIWTGLGQLFLTASIHPGSVGGYKAQITYYDSMGRTMKQSNPTEMYGNWTAAGDDASGWVFPSPIEYDWKGRPKKVYNQDGTFRKFDYAGCGCAGGEVVTLTDEMSRQQKVYSDVLGRQSKTEVLNWNGTVYSTTTSSLNARDQATLIRQFAGTDQSTTYQDTTMSFDGYGRLQTKHVPEQDAGTNTTWEYNIDDSIHKVTDARGASATYGYNNNRHLVTGITYSVPQGSNIPATPNMTFGYDAAGNRTLMTDGLGNQSYNYDSLSRITSETRSFSDPNNSAINGQSKTISYDYNLAGQLKSITDPAGATINYGFDSVGRLNSVSGSTFSGVTNYLSGAQYRAWGGVKHRDYSNSRTMDVGYNTRMQVSSFTIPGVMTKTYQYYADGQLSFSSNAADHHFDRSYSYDHAARLTQALSGAEARNEGFTNDRPVYQSFTYDALGHLTHRDSRVWTWQSTYSIPETYTNNRSSAAGYDAQGNQTWNGDATYTFDSASNITTVETTDPQSTTTRSLDGNSQQVKTATSTYDESSQNWTNTTTYYIRSTVLGGKVLTELNEAGSKQKTFVYADGEVLARQEVFGDQPLQLVVWEHRDPSATSYRTTINTGALDGGGELDSTGADVTSDPIIHGLNPEEGTGSLLPYPSFSNPTRPGVTYSVDGIPVSVDYFMAQLAYVTHDSPLALVEMSARASRTSVSYGASWVDDQGKVITKDYGLNGALAYTMASEMHAMNGTFITNHWINDNWTPDWSLIAPQNPPKPIPVPLPSTDAIRNRLNTGDCNAYIASLIAKANEAERGTGNVAVAKDGLELLNQISAQGGFVTKDFLKVGGWQAAGTISGSLAAKTATVVISTRFMYDNSASTIAMWQADYINTAIHEMVHLSARYSGYNDTQLATAASKLPGAAAGLPPPPKDANDILGISANSGYFDAELKKHCGGS